LRRAALSTIPSMRHLDMGKRLEHMAGLGFQPQTIVDVGAAEGAWSRMAAGIWPNARLIGFEPNQANEAKLERTRRELPQFAYHLCFLGAETGRVTYADRGTQTSLYTTHAEGKNDAEMRTLDACFEAGFFPQPQLLKLDVQGYELEVLEGGQRVLSGCEAVLAEVSFFRFHPQMPTADDVIAYLKVRGFVVYDTMSLLRLPEDDALGQMDFMFLRSDHRLRGKRVW
jgi:FkbM family methyltransferase